MKTIISFLILAMSITACSGGSSSNSSKATLLTYDSFTKEGGYTLQDYNAKWDIPYGLGEMGIADTRSFGNGKFFIEAAPFKTASNMSIYDHLKYSAFSKQSFPVPASGSVTFSAEIEVQTPGTVPGKVINGTYIQSGAPYSAVLREGQQAAAVLNMVSFSTGQLFDWFISGTKAFTILERLPSIVTNPTLAPTSPDYVGLSKMYTQIINEIDIEPGPHTVAIRYTRDLRGVSVEYFLDDALISTVKNIGIPLDKQGVPYTGYAPSLGNGEILKNKIDSLQIGHGLFSLVDAFPFQHPDAPELNVSVPIENRIFGQGIRAKFGRFTVLTESE